MRREHLYLNDIVKACEKVTRYTSGLSFDEFSQDEIRFDAVVRNLQVIGEAVRTLPEDVRRLGTNVEWTRIVGLRHLLVHHYFGIDEEIVWNLATQHVPILLATARDMLAKIPQT